MGPASRSANANGGTCRWADIPAVVLCLVAHRASADADGQHKADRHDGAASDEEAWPEDFGAAAASPDSLGPSRDVPHAKLRLVCKSWRQALDGSLEYLVVYR